MEGEMEGGREVGRGRVEEEEVGVTEALGWRGGSPSRKLLGRRGCGCCCCCFCCCCCCSGGSGGVDGGRLGRLVIPFEGANASGASATPPPSPPPPPPLPRELLTT